MRRIVTVFLMILTTGFYSAAQNRLQNENLTWLPFQWNDPDAKDVILLASRYDTLPYNFNWQLDTGSPYTFLNGATWNIFSTKFPYLQKSVTRRDTSTMGNYYKIVTPRFLIGDKTFLPSVILKNDNMGGGFPAEYLDKYRGFGIGTIGLDIFRDKVLILDFKENKIGYADSLSTAFYKGNIQTTNFRFFKNRIIVPVQIGKEQVPFMYDCGASMFTLQTTPKNSRSFAPANYTDTLFNINNGETGETHNAVGGKINKQVKILGKTYNDLVVYVEKGESAIFDEAKVAGIIGNKLFLNHIVIIDFRKLKFTLLD